MTSDVEEYTRQVPIDADPGDGTPGSVNWKAQAREWFDGDGTPSPRKVLGYIRRMHRMSVPFYGALCAYHRATADPEVTPSFTTCEQLRRSDAVPRFSDDSLRQPVCECSDQTRECSCGAADATEGNVPQRDQEHDRVRQRVRVDPFGLDDNQRFALDMAFKCGIEDVHKAMDFATKSLDAGSILSYALQCDDERRQKVLQLIDADEFGQARALATCGERSVQLGCPTHGGGCGCQENYLPISCDSRLCPDCMKARIGKMIERYTQPALGWDNPVFGTFTLENVTVECGDDLVRAVDAAIGAFGRLRNRTIPIEGEVVRETDDGDRVSKRWCWADDGGQPANDYWKQDLVRRGHRDRAERLEDEYVNAEYQRGGATVRGKNIPFDELVDAGIYSVDIKQKAPDEYNVHLHTMWDGAYIPQAALSAVWEDLTGDPVVDLRRVYDRGGGGLESAVAEVVAYACEPPDFQDVEQEVEYMQALKGKRLVQTFGDLHGEVPDLPATLVCAECERVPAWWDYLGVVNESVDNMGSIHDGESTGCDPPATP